MSFYVEDVEEMLPGVMIKESSHWLDEWWLLTKYDHERDAIVEAFRLSQCRGEDEEYPKYKVNGLTF